MKKRAFTVLILCVAVLVCLSGCSREDSALRFGTGSAGGVYSAYGEAIAPSLEESTGRSVQVIPTSGSEGNLRLLDAGLLDLALVQSDTLASAANGTGSFTDEALDGFSALGGVYTEACQIVVSASSGITSVDDMVGKRISIGEEDSGVTRNAEQILLSYGLTPDDLEVSRLSFDDSAAAMERGEIDGFFCTAGIPTEAVTKLADATAIQLVPLDERCIDQLTRLYDWYQPFTIPADTYPGVTADVQTVGVRAVLVVSNDLDDSTVSSIVNTMFTSGSTVTRDILKQAALDQLGATEGVMVGFHPAAASYYSQMGITVNEDSAPDEPDVSISVDMYQTMAIAVGILLLGGWLKRKWKPLQTFCIPSPVVGGLIFAVCTYILYASGIVVMNFDMTLSSICMVMFFTSVGFQANMKVLKTGGVSLLIFLGLVTGLIILQNVAAVSAASIIGVDPLIGMTTGSIPMVGGHGTAGAFGPVLEGLGLSSATTLATAAATFGLVVGSLMGGPVGRRLIRKHDLLKTAVTDSDTSPLVEEEHKHKRTVRGYAPAAYQLAIAMGLGTIVSWALSQTGLNFPIYIGAMIIAAIMRNTSEFTGKFHVPMGEINDIGGICLSLYLGMAMISLQLWQLADLALPLIILLGVQVVLMFIFSYFIVFNAMGRDYDAAVLSAGTCGFGMGATPNAMANMQAITEQFAPSVKAFILVPIVGSMFADFINSLVITFFINMV